MPAQNPRQSRTWRDLDAQRLHAMVEARLFGGPPEPTEVGRFRVEGRLGAGAMGVVYAAVDEQLGRRAALKLLQPHLEGDELGRARLLREARALARVEHENIVRIYEVGAFGDQIYLAMELVEGAPLTRWLGGGGRPWEEIVAVFLQAGRALAAAHRAGLLHRDFKPDNVLVEASGRARVLDFGLTRALEAAGPDDEPFAPLTRTGSVLGTPAYMAPEQLRGGPVGAQSDQFSFCVALYEALFRRRPFGQVPRVGALRIEPAPRDSRIPGRIRRALVRGLAERPEDRWPDMEALLAALAPRRGRGGGVALGVAAAGALGTLALALVLPARGPSEPASAAAPPATAPAPARDVEAEVRARHERALRDREAAERLLADDPSAALALLLEVEPTSPQIRRALGEPIASAIFRGHQGAVQRVMFGGDAIVTVDAAGQARGFTVAGERAAATPALPAAAAPPGRVEGSPGGVLTVVSEGQRAPLRGVRGPLRRLEWSGDGALVAAAGVLGEVWVAPRVGGRARVLAASGAQVLALAWAPAGRRLAFGREDGSIEVWQVEGRARRLAALESGAPVTALAFRADGRWLVGGGEDGVARAWFVDSERRAAPRVLRGHQGPIRSLAVRGEQVLTGGDDGSARLWHLWPAAARSFELGGPINAVAWSPDGQLLAAAGDRGVGLQLLPVAAGEGRTLADDATFFSVAWDPTGEQVAAADDRGRVQIWRARGGEARVLVERHEAQLALAWRPSGDQLAFAGIEGTLVIWDLAAGRPLHESRRARGRIEALAWAPLGARLAIGTSEGVVAIWGEDEGLRTRDVKRAVDDLAWSPAGDALAIAGDRRELLELSTKSSASTPLRTAAELRGVAWGPTGLAAGGEDGTLVFWAAKGERPEVLAAHGDACFGVAFEPGGARVASAGADGRVVVWELSDDARRARARAVSAARPTLHVHEEETSFPAG